jgi:hypothetical protein
MRLLGHAWPPLSGYRRRKAKTLKKRHARFFAGFTSDSRADYDPWVLRGPSELLLRMSADIRKIERSLGSVRSSMRRRKR